MVRRTVHVMLVGAACLTVSCSGADSNETRATPGTNAPVGVTASTGGAVTSDGPRSTGEPDAGAVLNTLWLVWTRDDEEAARTFATDEVIDALFAVPADRRARYDGGRCDSQESCAWDGPDGRWVVEVTGARPIVDRATFEPS